MVSVIFYSNESYLPPAEALVDRANLLNLRVPEMTVLVGGMRVLNANAGQAAHGVFTTKPVRSAMTSLITDCP